MRNGLLDVVRERQPEVLLLQELRCDEQQAKKLLAPLGYELTVRSSHEPGKSGVAILTRGTHRPVEMDLAHPVLDVEGRLLAVEHEGVQYWSCYAPSGASKRERLALKHAYLRRVVEAAIDRASVPAVVGGDLNVAHQLLDVEGDNPPRPRPGFMPVERALFDELADAGWVDLVRAMQGGQDGPFTWRSRSRGWRLDHLWSSPASGLRPAGMVLGPARPVSDHHLLLVDARGE